MSDDALLQNYIDPSQLRQDLQFDLTDLDESMSRHAGLFLHYSQAAVNARAQHDRFVAAFEILESQLDNSYRTTLKGENPKTTEPQIRAAIVEDPRWKAAQGRVIKAKTIWKLAEAAERAFEHRKDMLLQIAVPVSDEGKLGVIARNPYTLRTQEYTFWQSIPAGIEKAGKVISSYWEQLKMIVQPKTKMYEELGGFIAIGSIFPGDWNWEDFWLKTAFLSIILAVMNILPIPGLDGGHAIFTFWEMVTGRKVSDKVLEGAQYVGLVIILFLLLYANGNDIYRFFIK